MRFLIVILLLCHYGQVLAQRQVTPQVFSAHIRPLLNSIHNDFFHVLNQFPDFPKELPPLIHQLYEQQELKNQIPLECPRQLTAQCKQEISSLKNQISTLTFSLQSMNSSLKARETIYLGSLIGVKHSMNAMNLLWSLKTELDLAIFLIDAEIPTQLGSLEIVQRLDEVRTELVLSMLEFIPELYQPDFKTFYFEFIHLLRLNKTTEYLQLNLNRLDFNLNLFVQNLTKRNKKTPEGSNQYLQLMHMRWNGIQRYYK